jgi:hypothetical protein
MAAFIFNLGSGKGKWLNSCYCQFNPKKILRKALNIRFLVGPRPGLEVPEREKFSFLSGLNRRTSPYIFNILC